MLRAIRRALLEAARNDCLESRRHRGTVGRERLGTARQVSGEYLLRDGAQPIALRRPVGGGAPTALPMRRASLSRGDRHVAPPHAQRRVSVRHRTHAIHLHLTAHPPGPHRHENRKPRRRA